MTKSRKTSKNRFLQVHLIFILGTLRCSLRPPTPSRGLQSFPDLPESSTGAALLRSLLPEGIGSADEQKIMNISKNLKKSIFASSLCFFPGYPCGLLDPLVASTNPQTSLSTPRALHFSALPARKIEKYRTDNLWKRRLKSPSALRGRF